MADLLDGGPHDYFSDDKPVSRGQWKTIAGLALGLLGVRVPRSRYEASVSIVRMRKLLRDEETTRG